MAGQVRVFAWWLAFVAAPLGACRGGCSPTRPERRAAERALGELPAGARIVVSLDVDRVRTSTLWQRLSAATTADPDDSDAADRRLLEELTQKTGLDPFHHVHRVVAAFPEDARVAGAFALVVRAQPLDQARLVAYAQGEAARRGRSLEARERAGRKLWGSASGVAGFFRDDSTFVLGGAGWADAMADLTGGGGHASAADDAELVSLCERTGARHALWAAAIVPADTRRLLLTDPAAKDDVASSVMRLGFGMDLGKGLDASLLVELGTDDDARRLVARIDRTLHEARQSPQALVLGLVPFLAGVAVRQEGPNARVTVSLDEAQTETLAERVVGLMRLGKAAKPGRAVR